uniref:Uncharacterized protein n=1 Tax=Eutreptiella gymnastica TaxID=73025 RepID=A0A6T2DB22_9EUGL
MTGVCILYAYACMPLQLCVCVCAVLGRANRGIPYCGLQSHTTLCEFDPTLAFVQSRLKRSPWGHVHFNLVFISYHWTDEVTIQQHTSACCALWCDRWTPFCPPGSGLP